MNNICNYILEIFMYQCNFMISKNEELEENLLQFCDNSDDDILNSKKLYPIFEDVVYY
jgi:hypothetical protein